MAAIAELRAEVDELRERVRDGEPWLRSRAAQAYEAWFAQACANGRRPDALVRWSPVESERFFARVIQGPDGHCYWNGGAQFRRNDGSSRNPQSWWWEYRHGLITDRSIVKPSCGEPHCITVDHQGLASWGELRRRFTDDQCIGALQVVALRLGRTPLQREYDAARVGPSSNILCLRFSSWSRALQAAGLAEPERVGVFTPKWTADDCLDALRAVHAEHGIVPNCIWWTQSKSQPSYRTILRRFGSWANAVRAAGIS